MTRSEKTWEEVLGHGDPREPPYVYIWRFIVDEYQVDAMSIVRAPIAGEPIFMAQVRRDLQVSDENLIALRDRPFVKVGKSDRRSDQRLREHTRGKGTTYLCMEIPVKPVAIPHHEGDRCDRVILPGEKRLEWALHQRWGNDRIDPNREYFWLNDEMIELGLTL